MYAILVFVFNKQLRKFKFFKLLKTSRAESVNTFCNTSITHLHQLVAILYCYIFSREC